MSLASGRASFSPRGLQGSGAVAAMQCQCGSPEMHSGVKHNRSTAQPTCPHITENIRDADAGGTVRQACHRCQLQLLTCWAQSCRGTPLPPPSGSQSLQGRAGQAGR